MITITHFILLVIEDLHTHEEWKYLIHHNLIITQFIKSAD